MSREYQKELFKEFKEEDGKFKKITDKIKKARPGLHANMPLENIVIGAIIIIMAVIISFALGVERGKRIAGGAFPRALSDKKALPQEKHVPSKETIDVTRIELTPIEIGKPRADTAKSNDRPYAIQLISYKQRERAEREKNKLLQKKANAFIISLGDWYQVCAGYYTDMDEAETALRKFKREYKDCYIRRRP